MTSTDTDNIPCIGKIGVNPKTGLALFGFYASATAYATFPTDLQNIVGCGLWLTNGYNFIKAYSGEYISGCVTGCWADIISGCFIARLGSDYNEGTPAVSTIVIVTP